MDVNRERGLVSRNKADLDLDYTTLGDVLRKVQHLLDMYGADARVQKYQERYSDSDSIGVFVMEPETDAEMTARIGQEEYYDNRNAERERAEFERLKVKFGG